MRCLYTAVAEGREDHVFQGLRDETYKPGDALNVGPEKWRVDNVQHVVTEWTGNPKSHVISRTLHCTVVG